jgi:hypothetical protein
VGSDSAREPIQKNDFLGPKCRSPNRRSSLTITISGSALLLLIDSSRGASGTVAAQRVGAAMFDINREIELLERCASECELISGLATDQRARYDNEQLGSEYRHIAEELKSFRSKWKPQSEEEL